MSFKIATTAALSRNIFQRKKSSFSIASVIENNNIVYEKYRYQENVQKKVKLLKHIK